MRWHRRRLKMVVLAGPTIASTYGPLEMATAYLGPLGNVSVLDSAEVDRARQHDRNVFSERCRLAGLNVPDEVTMLTWWPGTKAVFK